MKWRRRRFQKRRAAARKLGFRAGSAKWREHLGLPTLEELRAQHAQREGLPTILTGNRKLTQIDMRAYINAPVPPSKKFVSSGPRTTKKPSKKST